MPAEIGSFFSAMTHLVNEINVAERQWIEEVDNYALDTLKAYGTLSGAYSSMAE